MTVLLESAEGGKTCLEMRTRFESVRIRGVMVAMGMETGWSESLEKLDELTSGSAAGRSLRGWQNTYQVPG